MGIHNNCRDSCNKCHTYYLGGCLAGHGDDLFIPIPNNIDIKELINFKKVREDIDKNIFNEIVKDFRKTQIKIMMECFGGII